MVKYKADIFLEYLLFFFLSNFVYLLRCTKYACCSKADSGIVFLKKDTYNSPAAAYRLAETEQLKSAFSTFFPPDRSILEHYPSCVPQKLSETS